MRRKRARRCGSHQHINKSAAAVEAPITIAGRTATPCTPNVTSSGASLEAGTAVAATDGVSTASLARCNERHDIRLRVPSARVAKQRASRQSSASSLGTRCQAAVAMWPKVPWQHEFRPWLVSCGSKRCAADPRRRAGALARFVCTLLAFASRAQPTSQCYRAPYGQTWKPTAPLVKNGVQLQVLAKGSHTRCSGSSHASLHTAMRLNDPARPQQVWPGQSLGPSHRTVPGDAAVPHVVS